MRKQEARPFDQAAHLLSLPAYSLHTPAGEKVDTVQNPMLKSPLNVKKQTQIYPPYLRVKELSISRNNKKSET